ncbi:MAG: DUF503 domain-containing protein [bacterium]
MFVATCEIDLLLGDVHSLKEKRAVVRPIIGELRRRFDVAVAETGHLDLHRRSQITAASVSATAGHAQATVGACEAWVAERPEVMVTEVRRRVFGGDDEGVQ